MKDIITISVVGGPGPQSHKLELQETKARALGGGGSCAGQVHYEFMKLDEIHQALFSWQSLGLSTSSKPVSAFGPSCSLCSPGDASTRGFISSFPL